MFICYMFAFIFLIAVIGCFLWAVGMSVIHLKVTFTSVQNQIIYLVNTLVKILSVGTNQQVVCHNNSNIYIVAKRSSKF